VASSRHPALGAVIEMARDIATGTVRREIAGLLLIGAGSILNEAGHRPHAHRAAAVRRPKLSS